MASSRKNSTSSMHRSRSKSRAGSVDSSDTSYRTGPNVELDEREHDDEELDAVPDDSSDEGEDSLELSLEGEGLEALDPEVGERTMVLPAEGELEQSASGAEEGADEANATRAGPPTKLEIIAGPDAGKVKKFKGVRMVIGRTVGVDLLLSDQSVSRRHVELVQGEDGVLLKDLGSGNGTKVNGVKVAEKKLEHGDQISIGKTMLRFVDEMAAFKKAQEERERREAEEKAAQENAAAEAAAAAEALAAAQAEELASEAAEPGSPAKPSQAAAPPKRPLLVVSGLAVAVVAVVVVLLLWPHAPPPVDEKKVIAQQRMSDAQTAAKQQEYQRALTLIAEAEQLSPGIDAAKLGATVAEALKNDAALAEALKAIEGRRFEDAKKALDAIQTGSPTVEESKAKLRVQLDAASLAYRQGKIDEFIAAGELDAASALVEQLPESLRAEPLRKLADRTAELEAAQAAQQRKQAAARGNSAARKQEQRAAEMEQAFVAVERKFAGSEWERAASECSRVMLEHRDEAEIWARAKKLQGLIPEFGKQYDDGVALFRQGKLGAAAKPLRQAHQLYGQMKMFANRFEGDVLDKFVATAAVSARESLQRDDVVQAWTQISEALRARPSDDKARAVALEVVAKAEALLEKAFALRDTNTKEAKRLLGIVLQVAETDSPLQRKAKELQAAMSREVPSGE